MIAGILSPENLAMAWRRVKANKGAPGIDGMSVEDFPEFCCSQWERIKADLMKGTYRPVPVRRVLVPKPDGTQRPPGVPTVLDRLVQQALAQVLSPLYEADFSTQSYGFRPNRSAHQAVETMKAGWQDGRRYAVDCDLKSFFDTVNHDKLMAGLRKKVSCPKTLKLIYRYLTAGVRHPCGKTETSSQGMPQGGPLSPLLANTLLDPLDKELEAREHHFARYADDFIILVRSMKAAQRVMKSVIRFCQGRLKLVINRVKSRAPQLKSCTFLGYQIGRGGKLEWTAEALARFKQRVRNITRRNRGHSAQDVTDELSLYLRGWLNYYRLSSTYSRTLELREWVRRRVRLYYWKQWKQPRTRRRHLLALGADPKTVHMATRSRKGYWRMSRNTIVHGALSNHWPEEQGVPDIRTTWIKLHYGSKARV